MKRLVGVLGSVLVVLLVAVALGQLLGAPVGFAYVETGSMQPTLAPGDGFVAVPPALAGEPAVGDVVVFRAETLDGGGLTTHRIVDVTDAGYVTRGDANPAPDQAADEPPVQPGQVAAVALQFDGSVVVVPRLGFAVESLRGGLGFVQFRLAALLGTRSVLGTQGLAYLFFAGSVLYYLLSGYVQAGAKDRRRERSRAVGTDPRLLVGALAVVLVVVATTTMVLPAGRHQFDVVSSDYESERGDVLLKGTSTETTLSVRNAGVLPVVLFTEPASDGVRVARTTTRLAPGASATVGVTLAAPDRTGYYPRYVSVDRYLAVLPASTLERLHGVHPWLPVVVIDVLLGGSFYAFGVAVAGRSRFKHRSRNGPSFWSRFG